mmetsp:Transcript_22651/g.48027  ORF Transcript_22651/g.48027 Transcript_22651/m.48027 type:complete len:302 (-) Transcript_22651:2976-3881(-)
MGPPGAVGKPRPEEVSYQPVIGGCQRLDVRLEGPLRVVVADRDVPDVGVDGDGVVLLQGKKRHAVRHLPPDALEVAQFGLDLRGIGSLAENVAQIGLSPPAFVSQHLHGFEDVASTVSHPALAPQVLVGRLRREFLQAGEGAELVVFPGPVFLPAVVHRRDPEQGLPVLPANARQHLGDSWDVVVAGTDETDQAFPRVLLDDANSRDAFRDSRKPRAGPRPLFVQVKEARIELEVFLELPVQFVLLFFLGGGRASSGRRERPVQSRVRKLSDNHHHRFVGAEQPEPEGPDPFRFVVRAPCR